MTAGAVDDAQTTVAEADTVALEGSGVIGPSMYEGGAHTPEEQPVGRAGETERCRTCAVLSWGG